MHSPASDFPALGAVLTYPFAVSPLPYAYNALEPYLDELTLRLHHDRHHQGYVEGLNAALQAYPLLHHCSVEYLLRHPEQVPAAIRLAVRNLGGGHANHQLFWKSMGPSRATLAPAGAVAAAITAQFGSLAEFQCAFEKAGTELFGAGWVFLVCSPTARQLKIITLSNQDSALPLGQFALLGNDVWEHAYYLRYQNKRANYLAAWWHVVNWEYVGQRFASIQAGREPQ